MEDLAYRNYWKRKKLLSKKDTHFPLLEYEDNENLSEAEKVIYSSLENAKKVLDFGAGDLRVKGKLQRAGYKGEYETLDIGHEFDYDHSGLESCSQDYDAIIILDVIEHIGLREGLKLLLDLKSRLAKNGKIIIQTPNGKCIRSPLATDMTHMQLYNLNDLWAYLEAEDMSCDGYRVVFSSQGGFFEKIKNKIFNAFVSRVLGCDYADNILLVAERRS